MSELQKSGASAQRAAIVGTGSYAPARVMTNADFEKIVDTTDEWITTRTGIKERHFAAEDEATSDMAAEAARRALQAAGAAADEVEMIVVATITPDMPFPNTACLVQEKIGARKAFCFDIEAACSGFVYAAEIARRFVEGGALRTALVIGAEKMSSMIDWKDRSTCVLFGDGAGAAVIQPSRDGRGIRGAVLHSDGSLGELLMVPGGGSRAPASHESVDKGLHFLKMQGREVFKYAVNNMTAAALEVLEKTGLKKDQIACVIPHQANHRIIKAVADRVGIPLERFFINVDRYGNTSAASVIIALDEAVRSGRVRPGDLVMFLVFGGGFTWGAMVLEWSG
ncbi:MAG: 3-oxoacyl-ACP synthase [Verrucomicrobia bacterium]|nr:MAG: 3-oxoacyl-ACP synthase [Verrucomicrobiota bacterium]